MPQARIFGSLSQFESALDCVRKTGKAPLSTELLIRLTHDAGLRIGEAALLAYGDIVDPHGHLTGLIRIDPNRTKSGRGRAIPMSDELRALFLKYFEMHGHREGPLFFNMKGRPLSPDTARRRIKDSYIRAGLQGCSSHSGRRTFATQLGRTIGGGLGSIRDLQLLLGHAYIETTMCYLEPSDRQAELIKNMWANERDATSDRRRPAPPSPEVERAPREYAVPTRPILAGHAPGHDVEVWDAWERRGMIVGQHGRVQPKPLKVSDTRPAADASPAMRQLEQTIRQGIFGASRSERALSPTSAIPGEPLALARPGRLRALQRSGRSRVF
jgi:hypothetical protein